MAGIFKPTYKDKKTGKTKKTAKWYAWLTLPSGKRLRKPLATDKSVAQAMLAQLVREAELEHAGIRDPYKEHRGRPLADHMDEWENHLRSKARLTPRAQRQTKQTVGRTRLVFKLCGFELMSDISPSKVIEQIAGFKDDAPATGGRKKRQKLSLETLNFYLRSCKQFCRWLVKDRRSPDNPLAHLQGWNAKLDRRHDRRALSLAEIQWLLDTTKASEWEYRELYGVDRQMLYSVALGTGLRASELASLTTASFLLNQKPPVVRLLAAYAKNQTEVDQPLPLDLVGALRAYLAGRPAREPVWPGTWWERSARMFRVDLANARKAWLPRNNDQEDSDFLAYQDGDGRFADFHCLRHTFISLLANSGVSPKLTQSLARHSDINLTMSRYAHVALHDQAAALGVLPRLGATGGEKPAERHAG